MNPRPISIIQLELQTAEAYRDRYAGRPSESVWASQMRADNDGEISRLQAELASAFSGDLEMSLTGAPVEGTSIAVPYLNRVLNNLQSTYRAVVKSLSDDQLRRAEVTLSITGTAPGSFKVFLRTPPAQLSLTEDPVADRGFAVILGLLEAAEQGSIYEVGRLWAERADEASVRSMIRFAASLAGSRGTTALRWRAIAGGERSVVLTAEKARSLATALSGQPGREVVVVRGQLEMAQNRPPRVRVRSPEGGDEYVAAVKSDELLDQVKGLLFSDVQATMMVDMFTSPTTGSPGTRVELLDLQED
jgi:hypothetical protein